jgi:glycosyltransferase involved in cell wall biosynthesis
MGRSNSSNNNNKKNKCKPQSPPPPVSSSPVDEQPVTTEQQQQVDGDNVVPPLEPVPTKYDQTGVPADKMLGPDEETLIPYPIAHNPLTASADKGVLLTYKNRRTGDSNVDKQIFSQTLDNPENDMKLPTPDRYQQDMDDEDARTALRVSHYSTRTRHDPFVKLYNPDCTSENVSIDDQELIGKERISKIVHRDASTYPRIIVDDYTSPYCMNIMISGSPIGCTAAYSMQMKYMVEWFSTRMCVPDRVRIDHVRNRVFIHRFHAYRIYCYLASLTFAWDKLSTAGFHWTNAYTVDEVMTMAKLCDMPLIDTEVKMYEKWTKLRLRDVRFIAPNPCTPGAIMSQLSIPHLSEMVVKFNVSKFIYFREVQFLQYPMFGTNGESTKGFHSLPRVFPASCQFVIYYPCHTDKFNYMTLRNLLMYDGIICLTPCVADAIQRACDSYQVPMESRPSLTVIPHHVPVFPNIAFRDPAKRQCLRNRFMQSIYTGNKGLFENSTMTPERISNAFIVTVVQGNYDVMNRKNWDAAVNVAYEALKLYYADNNGATDQARPMFFVFHSLNDPKGQFNWSSMRDVIDFDENWIDQTKALKCRIVTHTELVSLECTHEFYGLSDAFLMTSAVEGFGMPLVEAALHGCPVIASAFGSMGDNVLYGLKVPPSGRRYNPHLSETWCSPDQNGMAKAIVKLAKNGASRACIGGNLPEKGLIELQTKYSAEETVGKIDLFLQILHYMRNSDHKDHDLFAESMESPETLLPDRHYFGSPDYAYGLHYPEHADIIRKSDMLSIHFSADRSCALDREHYLLQSGQSEIVPMSREYKDDDDKNNSMIVVGPTTPSSGKPAKKITSPTIIDYKGSDDTSATLPIRPWVAEDSHRKGTFPTLEMLNDRSCCNRLTKRLDNECVKVDRVGDGVVITCAPGQAIPPELLAKLVKQYGTSS